MPLPFQPLPVPAIRLAMAVPWPSLSTSVVAPPGRPEKFCPGRTCPTRSGWLASTPLSMTATVIPLPVDILQMVSGACIASIHHSLARIEETVSAEAGPTALPTRSAAAPNSAATVRGRARPPNRVIVLRPPSRSIVCPLPMGDMLSPPAAPEAAALDRSPARTVRAYRSRPPSVTVTVTVTAADG